MPKYTVDQLKQQFSAAGEAWTPEADSEARSLGLIADESPKYTLDQMKKQFADAGEPWTPAVEQDARTRGLIADSPKMPWLKELGLGLGDIVSGVANVGHGQGWTNPADVLLRAQTGTTPAEQMTAGAIEGFTANNINRKMFDVPPPSSPVQMGFSAVGTGGGMVAPIMLTGGTGGAIASRLVAGDAAKEVAARALLSSGLTLGLYGAAKPGTPKEKLENFAADTRLGMVTAGFPHLPVVNRVASIPVVGRPLVDTALFTGMGVAEGQSPRDALINSAATMIPMQAAHAVTGDTGPYRSKEPRLVRTPAEMETDAMIASSNAAKREQMLAPNPQAEAAAAEQQAFIEQGLADRQQQAPDAQKQAPTTDLTLGSGPLQAAWEMSAKAAKGRARQLKGGFDTDWAKLSDALRSGFGENRDSLPFTEFNNSTKTWDETLAAYAALPRAVKSASELEVAHPKMSAEQKFAVAKNNWDLLSQNRTEVAAQLERGFTKKLGSNQAGFTDPIRKIQQVSDGYLGSALELSEFHGSREIDSALYAKAADYGKQIAEIEKRTGVSQGADLKIAGDLLYQFNPKEPDATFYAKPGVRDLLIKSGKPAEMMAYVREWRAMADKARADANVVRTAQGRPEIGNIEEYFPRVGEKPKFFQLREKVRRSVARESDPRLGTSDSEKVFNARTMHRSGTDPNMVEVNGRMVPRERNARTVLEGYIDSMLKSTGGDIALNNSMLTVEMMRARATILEHGGDIEAAKQMNIRADIVQNLAQQQWNHQLYGAGQDIENFVDRFGQVGRVGRDLATANKRQFDKTKYRFNPRFNVTQLLSTWLPVINDPVAGLLALKSMADPKARAFAMSTFEARLKNRPNSAIRSQADGVGTLTDAIKTGSPKKMAVRTKDAVADGLTQGVENFCDMFAALADVHLQNKRAVYTDKQRALSAGQAVFKTQSAFSFGYRPAILNSRTFQSLLPAQSFRFEAMNQLRESFGRVGVDSRLYGENRGDQVRSAFAVLASAALGNWVQNAMIQIMAGKEPEDVFTAQTLNAAVMTLPPAIYIALPGSLSGNSRPQYVLPVGQLDQAVAAAKTGNKRRMVATAAGNWGDVGGAFTADVLRGRYSSIGIGSKDWQDNANDFTDTGSPADEGRRVVGRPVERQANRVVNRPVSRRTR